MGRRSLRELFAAAQLADRDVQRARFGAQRDSALANAAVGALSNAGGQVLGFADQQVKRADEMEGAEADAFAQTHASDKVEGDEDPSVTAAKIMGRWKPPAEGPKEGTIEHFADRVTGGPGRRERAGKLATGKLATGLQARADKDAAAAAAKAKLDEEQYRFGMKSADEMEQTLTREISDLDKRETDEEQFDRTAAERERHNVAMEKRPRGAAGGRGDPLADLKREKLEAQTRGAKAAADLAEGKAREGTVPEQKRRAAVASSDRMLTNIDKMIAEKEKFNTGAIASRAKDLGNVVGWKTPGWATFKARTVSEINKYIKEMTGASAGVQEMRRLASVMATPTLDDEEFLELLLLFKEEAANARAQLAATAPASGEPEADAPDAAAPFTDDNRWQPGD